MPLRVLHVCTSIDPASGGPANVLHRLARVEARQGGHRVHVVTADDPARVEDVARELDDAGVRFMAGGPARGPFARGPRVAGAIAQALADGLDILHIHGLWQHAPHHAAKAARRAGVPYVFRPCGMLDPWSLNQGRLKKRIFLAARGRRDLNAAAALHYTTQTEMDLAVPLRLRPRGFVVPNGVDWEEFDPPPTRGRFRAAHAIGDRPLVVLLSRLHPKKGLDLLLPAFAGCGHAQAVLALVGPGEPGYVDGLRRQAAAWGIADRTIFAGLLTGSARLEALADADLFCLPSYQENFGVVVIEALGCGTPVLISDQVNIHREVDQAGVGVVVPCEVEPLQHELRRLLGDPARLAKLRANARPWVERTLRWTVIVERIDALYRAVAMPASYR